MFLKNPTDSGREDLGTLGESPPPLKNPLNQDFASEYVWVTSSPPGKSCEVTYPHREHSDAAGNEDQWIVFLG